MAQAVSPTDSRIVRSASPQNLEADFASLDSFITPVEKHYIRNHYPVPVVDAASWKLVVDGAVRRPLAMGIDALRAMPATTHAVTLECAGNGRLFLTPKVSGVQWAQGAVSTAEWTGVLLGELLDRAGLRPEAVDVVADGLDIGPVNTSPRPAGEISYHRGLAVREAVDRGALIAYAMNGAPLPPAHGFPARLVVPGAYGMAAVKWLRRLAVTAAPFDGYWQTTDYAYWDRSGAYPQRRPLLGIQVKSLIARPVADAQLARATAVEVTGAAWSEGSIARVDVSSDGGATWQPASFMDAPQPGVWRRWRHNWQTPATAGASTLMSRATDSLGRVQPMTRNPDYGSYVVHHVVPVSVQVT
jgi:DMSO/TMAO reductase YedYZ molybdopterin-dependent catalytic subunit